MSLPTWENTIAYEEGDRAVAAALQGGYPRFVLHSLVERLADYVAQKNGVPGCFLFRGRAAGKAALSFVQEGLLRTRALQLAAAQESLTLQELQIEPGLTIQALLYHQPDSAFLAKAFWQHTGTGISTRLAEHCLRVWELLDKRQGPVATGPLPAPSIKGTLDLITDARVKKEIRSRIANTLNRFGDTSSSSHSSSSFISNSREDEEPDKESCLFSSLNLSRLARGKLQKEQRKKKRQEVGPGDVRLFPSGMAAVYAAHQLAKTLFPGRKSVQFG